MPYSPLSRDRERARNRRAQAQRRAMLEKTLTLARTLAAADPPIPAEAARDAARQALGVSQTTGE